MELKWLVDFLSVANTGSFSASAQERNVTQPALSRRIRSLETWIGSDLIDRSTYPTKLTAAGRAFRSVAQDVVHLLDQQRDEIRGERSKAAASIRFSALHTLSLTFYPRWLREIENKLGPLNSRLMPDNLHDCVSALTEGDCDFLLCYAHENVPILLDPSLFPSVVVDTDRLLLVGPPESKSAFPGTPSEPLRYLAYTADCFLGRVVDCIAARQENQPHLRLHYENPMAESLKAMALEGHGVAWLPESCCRRELENGQLIRLGGEGLGVPLEVKVYRSVSKSRPLVASAWMYLLAANKKSEQTVTRKAV